MTKKFICLSITFIMLFSFCDITLFANNCNHDWSPATCTRASYCRICGEIRGTTTEHKFKILEDNSQKCIYCRYAIQSDSPKIECKYCNIFFDTQEKYKEHIKIKHPATKPSKYKGITVNKTIHIRS